jgi:hypothetical protein
VGSGTKPVKVSATVTGLMPGTTYHYRLVCQNRGGQAAGRDRKFKTKKQHVKTGPARNRHSTSGTLTGTVNPNGLATTCWFKYGRTKAFGSVTRNQSVGSGTHTRAVHATVHGLQPKTRYYDRLVCTSAAGRVRGGARTFATLNQIRFRGSHTITVSSTGRFVVDLHCNGNAHCAGVLTLTDDDGTVLARVHYVVDAHQTKHVHMRVTSSALQRLSRRHHLSGQLRARNLDSSSDSRRVRLVAG